MKKKKIAGIIILILGIIIVKILYNPQKEKNTSIQESTQNETVEYNNNPQITEEKNINNIIFTDIKCSYDGTYSLLTYKIINKTNQTIKLEEYEIIIKDKNNNILANISPSISQELKPQDEIETGNAIDIDLREAYSLELVIPE
ncbi:MAG: hypothetical protein MR598_03640 [Erysipelotrichaceae bacterium]|nr:hypothetical protein [Erysipelotrichaceae bacterium]